MEIRIPRAWIHRVSHAFVPSTNLSGTLSGYYEDPTLPEIDLDRLQGVSAYVTLNPVRKSLMGRTNRNCILSVGKDDTTSDDHIDFWQNIYLDIDSNRDTGISATDAELQFALDRQSYLLEHEPEIRNASIWGCSGNGGWAAILVKTLPRTNPDLSDESWVNPDELVAHFLTYLAHQYSTENCKVDPRTKNASRIGCIAGTYKCKGSHLEGERPWRPVTLDSPDRAREPLDLAAYCAAHELPDAAKSRRSKGKSHAAVTGLVWTDGTPIQTNGHTELVLPSGGRGDVYDRQYRYTAYLSAMRPAVSGSDGHGQTFDAACAGVKGFGLDPSDAFLCLAAWNQTCQPPWTENELWHKLNDAEAKADDKPRGYLYEAGNHDRDIPSPPLLDDRRFEMGDEGTAGETPKPEETTKPPTMPVVLWTPREMIANDKVISHMWKCDGLYQKDCMLVKVVREDSQRDRIKWLDIPSGTPMISPVSTATLREMLSSLVAFAEVPQGKTRARPIHVPDKCVLGIHAREHWDGIRRLISVVEHPIIRPDGSIASEPGYDRDTGILWIGEPIEGIPDFPSQSDAEAAAAEIMELIAEFEFEDNVSRAVWLAGLLTIVGRNLINGNIPLFYFDANAAGSGKSLLCDLISCIATGREMARTAYYHDPVEMDKRIVSVLLGGLSVCMLDNIDGEFGNSTLDNILTARYFGGRILGMSKWKSLIVSTVFFATANNAVMCGDLHRRTIKSRLISSCENPDQERTRFKIQNLTAYAVENRPRLLRATLTILRAYLQAGCPHNLPTNVYSEWTQKIRGCVKWAIKIDPWEHRSMVVRGDTKRATNSSFLRAFAKFLVQVRERAMTTAEILEKLDGPMGQAIYKEMHEAVLGLCNCRKTNLPSVTSLGNRMGKLDMMVAGKLRLAKDYESHSRSSIWWVQRNTKGSWMNLRVPAKHSTEVAEDSGRFPIQTPPYVHNGQFSYDNPDNPNTPY